MTKLVLADVSVPVEVAKEKVVAYREAVRETRRTEDVMIARAFAEAARGRRIINLPETVRSGGFDAEGFPRIAVCRATATRCAVALGDASVLFYDDMATLPPYRYQTPIGAMHVRVDWPDAATRRREWLQAAAGRSWAYRATSIMPNVPPEHRPPRRHRQRGAASDPLASCHVLYEAEWTATAPRDPALIRHIGGELWSVLAIWDLTELERAVIAGTRRG